MSDLLTAIGTVFTKIFTWIPDLFDMITETNLLLVAVGISITGVVVSMAIGIFKRV